MNSEDPIQHLEAHYRRLQGKPAPDLRARTPFRWWEAAGGLAAGAAVVVLAVTMSLSTQSPPSTGPSPILESQMRSAGLLQSPPAHLRHAQLEGTWHI